MKIYSYIKNYLIIILLITLALVSRCSVVSAQDWDIDLLKKINPDPPTSKYWQYTSLSAYYVPASVSIGQLIYGIGQGSNLTRNRSYETFISISLGTIIGEVLKFTVREQRPSDRYRGEIFVNSPTKDPSFPSGHTILAFATATSLALEYKKWYVTGPAYLWAGSVGFSRMYLGKHYPSDVLAGAAIGALSGVVSHRFSVNVLKSYNMK
jgi:membrane-associated phospholipid phosphatase